jgi:hypothetical protein
MTLSRSTATRSLDHLVGGGNKTRRKYKPKDASGSEIDDEIELRRLVDGKIAGLSPSQDAIDIARRLPKVVRDIRLAP